MFTRLVCYILSEPSALPHNNDSCSLWNENWLCFLVILVCLLNFDTSAASKPGLPACTDLPRCSGERFLQQGNWKSEFRNLIQPCWSLTLLCKKRGSHLEYLNRFLTGPEFLEMALPNMTCSISVSLGNRRGGREWSHSGALGLVSTEEHHQSLTALEETATSWDLLIPAASPAGVQECLSCRGCGRAAEGKRLSVFQQAHGLHFLNLAVS